MLLNMNFACYSSDHIFWIAIVAIPTIIIWVVGCPLLAFYILFRNRKYLEEEHVKSYMLVLYQGLKPEVFYWEFVNTIRKALILC